MPLSPVSSEEDDVLTVPEAARRCRLNVGLTYERIRQGQIPALHFGRAIRVPRRALERMLAGESGDPGKAE